MYLGHRVPEWRQTRPGSGSTLQERASYSPRVGKGGKGAPKTAAEAQSRGVALSLHAPAVRKDTTSFRTLGSRVTIKNCWATSSGAGIHILKGGFDSNDTEMLFEHCRSGSKGGAIFAEDTILRQRGGVMTFRYSKAVWGGSIYVRRLIQEKGTMNFLNSTSRKNGGAISTAKGVHQEGGLLSFEHCESQKLGGAIMVSPQAREESIRSRGVIRCADTYALMGGCLATIGRGVVALDTFELNHSASQVLGNLAYVRGAFSANAVHIADESVRIDAAIVGLNTSNVSFLNCSKTPSCHLRAVILALGPAVCSPGSGIGAKLAGGEEFRGCFRCEDGKAQLKEALNPRCQTCPYEADKCEPNLMQLEPGVMAKSDNFTRVLHCPNAKACPGGSAPLSDALPMCAEGHDGDGCANCSTGFGRSDSSVLVCVKCAAGWKAEGLQLVYFVLSDVLLLAVATSSVLGASATSQDSSVLLNQLMSFATVAQTVLSAISQTAAYNQLSSRLKLWLEVSGVVSAIAQGESSWSMSRECLLVSLGLPKTLWHAHLVSALLQGVLLALLICLQGFWFAFVVWTNCFAPSIAASFGRYLVGYRLEPESIGGKMHWPFLPPVDNSYEFVFGMLVLCLVATTGGWWMAANSKLSPDPDYVVFLVRNYKPAYRNWETERLMRKMLLRLVAAALPIAYSPALQMWCVCLILSASLLSYSIQRPYRLELFNQVETLLLCVALVLAFSASAVLANEKHWGSSRNTQVLVLLSMSVLATVTTVTLSALVARRLYKERIRKFFTDADDS
ncbi:pmpB [Symbiodinium pilosum]|uniref:PmpB protein n=1 Tax=Symbiodinium pilosum TaxID=2952 RepID=A0A812J5I5_SYMPI|nr:pmpB [Symbiodinium pilosum]